MSQTGHEEDDVTPRSLRLREGDQQLPEAAAGPVMHDRMTHDLLVHHADHPAVEQVILDIAKRKELGISRYGQPLRAHNGRDSFRDAYEEALDMSVYLLQALHETGPHGLGARYARVLVGLYDSAVHTVLKLKELILEREH